MTRLITTYIFKEMAIPFILSVVLLSATILLGNILKLLELLLTQGAGFINIATLIITMIPSFMIYTLPASFLVSVLIACTRLSSDNEFIALKASGLSLTAIIKPVFLMAIIIYIATMLVTLYVYPWSNYNYKKHYLRSPARTPERPLPRRPSTINSTVRSSTSMKKQVLTTN